MTTTGRRPAPHLLVGAPLIELPTTQEGWAGAARELSARIYAYVYWSMGGESIPSPRPSCDEGRIPFGGAQYEVGGLFGCVWDTRGHRATADVEQRVADAVRRAHEAARELPDVSELVSMWRAVEQYLSGAANPSQWYPPCPAELSLLEQGARDALLWVAARSLTGLAQTVATTHARADFPGTCAELIGVSTAAAVALAAAPVATARR